MSRHIRLDIAPATATHCGNGGLKQGDACEHLDKWAKCRAFGRKPLSYDEQEGEYRRLPECLAAEKGASE